MREKVYDRLAAVRKQYKSDYHRRVRETLVFKTNGLLTVYRPPLGVRTKYSKTTDKPTCNKLLRRADRPDLIISAQQKTLTIKENRTQETISIDRTTPGSSKNTIGNVGYGRHAMRGETARDCGHRERFSGTGGQSRRKRPV